MRRTLLTLSAVLALAVLANPVDAQLKFGAQGAVMTGLEEVTGGDLNGTFGLGGRVMFSPPLFPLGVVGSATYYFPEGDGTYWTATAAAQLGLPLPMIRPYVTAGWQVRNFGEGIDSENGPMVGAGVQLNLGVSLFLEGTMEFNDEIPTAPDFDNNPFVVKGGILFG